MCCIIQQAMGPLLSLNITLLTTDLFSDANWDSCKNEWMSVVTFFYFWRGHSYQPASLQSGKTLLQLICNYSVPWNLLNRSGHLSISVFGYLIAERLGDFFEQPNAMIASFEMDIHTFHIIVVWECITNMVFSWDNCSFLCIPAEFKHKVGPKLSRKVKAASEMNYSLQRIFPWHLSAAQTTQ